MFLQYLQETLYLTVTLNLQETLYLTIFMIDKFLQTEGPAIKRNKLQLVGVAAMFTASKVTKDYLKHWKQSLPSSVTHPGFVS